MRGCCRQAGPALGREARLAESEQRFRLTFANAPTGLCEVGVEPGGRPAESARRHRVAVSQRRAVHGRDLHVTTSIGSSLSLGAGAGHELLERADRAVYVAKDASKDRVSAAAGV